MMLYNCDQIEILFNIISTSLGSFNSKIVKGNFASTSTSMLCYVFKIIFKIGYYEGANECENYRYLTFIHVIALS